MCPYRVCMEVSRYQCPYPIPYDILKGLVNQQNGTIYQAMPVGLFIPCSLIMFCWYTRLIESSSWYKSVCLLITIMSFKRLLVCWSAPCWHHWFYLSSLPNDCRVLIACVSSTVQIWLLDISVKHVYSAECVWPHNHNAPIISNYNRCELIGMNDLNYIFDSNIKCLKFMLRGKLFWSSMEFHGIPWNLIIWYLKKSYF